MALYHFHIHENGQIFSDLDGCDLENDDAARRECRIALSAIAQSHLARGDDRQDFAVVVTDGSGAAVYSATLTYAGLSLR